MNKETKKVQKKVPKKVLLTGATGLIGKYAIKPLLDLNYEIWAVSTSKEGFENGVNWIKANLLDLKSIKSVFEKAKPQYLLHFAWDTTAGTYLESNLNFDWVQSSLEMLKQFHAQGGKRAVFAGTCFEYEFSNLPLKEDGKLNPTHTYSKCKNHLHNLAEIFCAKNNISFGWGRIFYVYGEGEQEKRLIPFVIKALKEGKEFSTASGDLIKDYLFAGDIAEGFVKFLDSKVEGSVNICTGEPVKIKDIVNLIAKKLGKENLVKFEVDAEKIKDQPQIIIGDSTRLTNEVKYKPSHTLEEGIDIMLKSF